MTVDVMKWLRSQENAVRVPLFETDKNGVVQTKLYGKTEKPILKRHPKMEDAVIKLIENNLTKEEWEGILYVMVRRHGEGFIPLYVGKAEKKGVSHSVSANIKNIAKNKSKFARWGDGLDYHMGDLSHAIFNFEAYRKPTRKYKRWAEVLFDSFAPPVLKAPVDLILLPWYGEDVGPSGLPGPLPAVEKEVISLAGYQYSDDLLNVDGK